MARCLRFLVVGLAFSSLALGCGSDEDDGEGIGGPSGGAPPAAMIATWTYQSVVVDGTAATLPVVLDWAPNAVAANFPVLDASACIYEEVDVSRAQLGAESGFVFIDGGEMDINLQFRDGMVVEEPKRVAWSIIDDTFTVQRVDGSGLIVFTLARE